MGSSYDDWTVHQLKWALKERGLPVGGKKRVLIERLESNEGLEGSPKGKNFFEEWAPDDEDSDLVEQIREKYGAPDYRASEIGNENVQVLNLAIIVLCISGIATSYFFTAYRQMEETELLNFPCVTALIVSFVVFFWIAQKAEESNVSPSTVPTSTAGLLLLIIVTSFVLGWISWRGFAEPYTSIEAEALLFFYCCSSMFLLVIPLIALSVKSTTEANEKASSAGWSKRETERLRLWKNAQDFEKYGQFDIATEIWSKLGEEGELERVAGLKVEYLCVFLKRKIMNLAEQGVDCTQLEEQLATAETASEALLTIEDSTINQSPDVNQEEYTEESLKEIEEDENNLVKDKMISKPDEEA